MDHFYNCVNILLAKKIKINHDSISMTFQNEEENMERLITVVRSKKDVKCDITSLETPVTSVFWNVMSR